MSDHVIIVGVRRGKERVGTAELKQELGRQGRQQNGLQYRSDIILNDDDFEIEKELASKGSYDAVSVLNDLQTFCFHVLPLIVSGEICDRQGLQDFYDKSLASFQEKKLDIEKVLLFLEERKAIFFRSEGRFSADENGIIASNLYLHCGDVKRLRDNFERVSSLDLSSDGAIAWALGNLETLRIQGDFGNRREEISRFMEDLPPDYECEEGCLTTSALWWCMMGNGVAGKQMANNVRHLKKQWSRLSSVLSFCHSLKPEFISILDLRISRNLNKEIVPFFSDLKMTKSRAMGLLALGYSNAEGTENVELENE